MPDVTGSMIVVPADLETAGTDINASALAIDQELVALKGKLAPLAENWSGWSASYYQPLQQEWDIAADGLFGPTGVLGRIAQAMNLVWNNYTDCEWSNAKTWQR